MTQQQQPADPQPRARKVDNKAPQYALSAISLEALRTLATLAPTLSEVELKICLHLTPAAIVYEQQHPGWFVAIASIRKLADATGAATSSVQNALASLVSRRHLTKHRGSAEKCSSFLVNFLKPLTIQKTVPAIGTGVDRSSTQGVPNFGTGVSRPSTQGVPNFDTPLQMDMEYSPHARASIDSDSDSIQSIEAATNPQDPWKTDVLERVATAQPSHFETAAIKTASRWLQGYATKFHPTGQTPHPPDARIVAQFLAVAPWPTLERLLYELMTERLTPGAKYGAWFVAVALQRLHGIGPDEQKKRRADLRVMSRRLPPPQEPPWDAVPAATNDFSDLSGSSLPQNCPELSHGTEINQERPPRFAARAPGPAPCPGSDLRALGCGDGDAAAPPPASALTAPCDRLAVAQLRPHSDSASCPPAPPPQAAAPACSSDNTSADRAVMVRPPSPPSAATPPAADAPARSPPQPPPTPPAQQRAPGMTQLRSLLAQLAQKTRLP
jgi:hypothetical protein